MILFFMDSGLIAKDYTFHHLFKLLRLLSFVVIGLLTLSLLWIFLIPAKPKELPSKPASVQANIFTEKGLPSESYDSICTGPLKLSPALGSFPLPDLKKEMCFYGKNTRPDVTVYDLLMHIGLIRSGERHKVISGQKLYLTCSENGPPALHFSSKPTPLWIMPSMTEKGETLVEVGVYLQSDQNEKLIEETKSFAIEQVMRHETLPHHDLHFKEALASLEKSEWWDPDLLYETYGGEIYHSLGDQERVTFIGELERCVTNIKKENAFIWKEEKWEPITIGQASRGYPLALVKKLSGEELQWELWSAEGLEKTVITKKKHHLPKLNLRVEEVFSRIRQRTASRISCRIGKTTAILKEGDWLLKTQNGWRVLISLKEIEDVLSFKTKGELFVFEGIEKKEGKPIFSGTFFDEMRTQKLTVNIPIASQNNQEQSLPKKKTISSKIQTIPSEQGGSIKKEKKIKRMIQEKQSGISEGWY